MEKLKSLGAIIALAFVLFIVPQNVAAKDDSKTVSITVSGSGVTKDAAQQSALRSAIEQTFGVFISSKTEIFNDQVVADEIASIASGNIQSFKILNASQLPDGNWGVTLNAVVSVSKLTSFVQAKGVSVEIQGGLFAINIKQQLLNEAAETKAVEQLSEVLSKPLHNAFDYKIEAKEPKSLDGTSNNFGVELVVTATANKNMEFCAKYLIKSLSSICMDKTELANYRALNKKVYEFVVTEGEFKNKTSRGDFGYYIGEHKEYKAQVFFFRNPESLKRITDNFTYKKGFNTYGEFYISSFEVKTGLKNILGDKMFRGGSVIVKRSAESNEINRLMNENDRKEKRDNYEYKNYVFCEYAPIGYDRSLQFYLIGEHASEKKVYSNSGIFCFPPIGKTTGEFYWREKYKLKELEQLKGFSVKPYVNYAVDGKENIVFDSESLSAYFYYNSESLKISTVKIANHKIVGSTWVECELTNYKNSNGLFQYTMQDQNGNKYIIEYTKELKKLNITEISTGKTLVLNKRQS